MGPKGEWFCTILFCPSLACMHPPMCVYVCKYYVYVCMVYVYIPGWVYMSHHAQRRGRVSIYIIFNLVLLKQGLFLNLELAFYTWSLSDPLVSNLHISGVTDECGPVFNLLLASWDQVHVFMLTQQALLTL